jgi:hypothetical protein
MKFDTFFHGLLENESNFGHICIKGRTQENHRKRQVFWFQAIRREDLLSNPSSWL